MRADEAGSKWRVTNAVKMVHAGGQLGLNEPCRQGRDFDGAGHNSGRLKVMFETKTKYPGIASPKGFQPLSRRGTASVWACGRLVRWLDLGKSGRGSVKRHFGNDPGARRAGSFIPLILIVEKRKFVGIQMNPDEQPEGQPEPAGEKPAAPAASEGQRRSDSRRPRFRGGRRGGRGGRGGGGGRDSRPDDRGDSPAPRERESGEARPAGDLRTAIEQVEEVQADLEKVLEDINEILRTLVQADREKTGSEREIEMLRESLRRLRGDRGGYRQPRSPSPEPAHAPEPGPAAPESDEPEDQEEHDNPA